MAEEYRRPKQNVLELFEAEKRLDHGFLRVSAPMVRYSKLEFRKLLRQHGVQLTFTPMIIADSFNNSQKARENEFTTSADDRPVVAQFAARDVAEFVTAAQLIYPYVDGVDLNCGCPQSWAIAKGYGCGLLRQPELVRDMIHTVRRTLPQDLSVSLKIRLLGDDEQGVRNTVELARQMEMCGATFLTLHGRTARQRSSDPLNVPAIAAVKDAIGIPLVANGSVRSWSDACALHKATGADGIMAARGLLSNPTIFNPAWKDRSYDGVTALECAQQWLDIASRASEHIQFQCLHHHFAFLWSSHAKKPLRLEFNRLGSKQQIFEFFARHFDIHPSPSACLDPYEYTKCTYTGYTGSTKPSDSADDWQSSTTADGKFFAEFSTQADESDDGDDDFELADSFFNELHLQ